MSKKAFQMTDKQGNDVFPIGAEVGSNANGNYIKFADGTMIQFGSTSISLNNDMSAWGSIFYKRTACTFPTDFVNDSYQVVLSSRNASGWVGAVGIVKGVGSFEYEFYRATQRIDTVYLGYIAIGRWR